METKELALLPLDEYKKLKEELIFLRKESKEIHKAIEYNDLILLSTISTILHYKKYVDIELTLYPDNFTLYACNSSNKNYIDRTFSIDVLHKYYNRPNAFVKEVLEINDTTARPN